MPPVTNSLILELQNLGVAQYSKWYSDPVTSLILKVIEEEFAPGSFQVLETNKEFGSDFTLGVLHGAHRALRAVHTPPEELFSPQEDTDLEAGVSPLVPDYHTSQ